MRAAIVLVGWISLVVLVGAESTCCAQVFDPNLSIRGVYDFSREYVMPDSIFPPAPVRISLDHGIPRDFELKGVPLLGETELGKDIGTVINSLKAQKSLALILNNRRERTTDIQVLARDLPADERSRELVFQQIKGAFTAAWRNDRTSFLVVRKHKDEGGVSVHRFAKEDLSSLEKIWWKALPSGRPCRCVCYRETAILVVPPFAAEPEQRLALSMYRVSVEALLARMDDAKTARDVEQKTTSFFAELNQEDLQDNRSKAYSVQWSYQLRPALMAGLGPKGPTEEFKEEFKDFQVNLAALNRKGTCTVTVSASNGIGADVRYAKAADASAGRFKAMGTTVAVRQLEQANYVFQSFRNGKKTGETSEWDCTGDDQTVTIIEEP